MRHKVGPLAVSAERGRRKVSRGAAHVEDKTRGFTRRAVFVGHPSAGEVRMIVNVRTWNGSTLPASYSTGAKAEGGSLP